MRQILALSAVGLAGALVPATGVGGRVRATRGIVEAVEAPEALDSVADTMDVEAPEAVEAVPEAVDVVEPVAEAAEAAEAEAEVVEAAAPAVEKAPVVVEAREEQVEAKKPAAKPTPKYAPSMPSSTAAAKVVDGKKLYEDGKLRFKRFANLEKSLWSDDLARPQLLDGSHAGDRGFDPLGIAKDNKQLYALMESEVRHCRLAMLCAAGWPLSELRPMLDGALLADGGRAPSVLNGHLFDSPLSLLTTLAFFTWFSRREIKALTTTKKETLYGHIHAQDLAEIEEEWPWGVAGDEGFDPLGLYGLVGKDAIGRFVMRDLEIAHGRMAMLGVAGYVFLEAVTGKPVVEITPFLF